jgi:hypothetical protein
MTQLHTRFFFVIVISFLSALPAYTQVQGCTDPMSTNYNPLATINDGSCTYTTSSYTPTIKVDPMSDSLKESSGLLLAGGSLWSFNDGGGTPTLYRIDTNTNALLQRVILSGVVNKDWEDIAFDGVNIYVGDFGNSANGARTDLKILKFPLDQIPADYINNPLSYIPADKIEKINFVYADQPQPPVAVPSNTAKYDCEAMIVDNGKIHLFSKNFVDNSCTHYVINANSAGNYTAVPMEILATNYLVTAADKVAGQNIIALLGYQNSGTASHFIHILSDYRADSFFAGNNRLINLPDVLTMGQSEGLIFREGKYGYISNEKFFKSVGFFTIDVKQKLRSFDISNFVNDYFTGYVFNGNGNWSDSANWKYNLVPPANLVPGNSILIDPAAGGNCTLDIQYKLSTGTKLQVTPGKNFIIEGDLQVQ